MGGLYFEQFEIGRSFEYEIRRTVTESDNVWFCGVTCNPARIHLDGVYCASTEFKRHLVNSIFTLGLVIGLSDQRLYVGRTTRGQAKADRASKILNIEQVILKTNGIRKVFDDLGQVIEGIFEFIHPRRGTVAESRIVGCNQVESICEKGH